jgi:hypothetical protein
MTLDEAIQVLRQHNEKGTSVLRITGGQALEKDLLTQVLDSCEQLISEKAEYKRLLKAAVEDMTEMQFGKECKVCSKNLLPNECPIHNNVACIHEKDFKWRYADEALKLIGDENDAE